MTLGPLLPDNSTVLDEEIDAELKISAELPDAYGKAALFNFDPDGIPGFELRGAQGKLTITDDQRGLLTWIQKALRTPRGMYAIYDENYGTDLAGELGRLGIEAIHQTGEDDIRRCLLIHPLIEDVQDIVFSQSTEKDVCLITMTVYDTISGPFEIQVGF